MSAAAGVRPDDGKDGRCIVKTYGYEEQGTFCMGGDAVPRGAGCGIRLFGSYEGNRPVGHGAQDKGVPRCVRSGRLFVGSRGAGRGAVRGGARRGTHAAVRYGAAAGRLHRFAVYGVLHPADARDRRLESGRRLRLFRGCAPAEQLDDLRQERRAAAHGRGGVARCAAATRVGALPARGGPDGSVRARCAGAQPLCVVRPAAGGWFGLPQGDRPAERRALHRVHGPCGGARLRRPADGSATGVLPVGYHMV